MWREQATSRADMMVTWGDVVLDEEEVELLRLGVSHWGGPEYGAELVCRMLELASVDALYQTTRDLRQKLELDEPLHHDDQARALLLTEVMFGSRVAGMGSQWPAITGCDDPTTVRVLRSLQRKLRFSSRILVGPKRPRAPSARSAYASVRVRGPALDPLVVTQALRIPPDRSHRRGEPRLSLSKSHRVLDRGNSYPSGHWSFSSKGRVSSKQVGTHVRWLLELLQPRAEAVRQLADTYRVDIFCFAMAPDPPAVAGGLRERAAGLGLVIEVDYYETSASLGVRLPEAGD